MYNIAQFWDGRAKDLQEQAAGPVANPLEMGAQWDEVVEKLTRAGIPGGFRQTVSRTRLEQKPA